MAVIEPTPVFKDNLAQMTQQGITIDGIARIELHDTAGAQAQATELSLLTPDDARVKLLLANIEAAEKASHPAPEPTLENPAPTPQ